MRDPLWRGVIHEGPLCLTRHYWDVLEPDLSSTGRAILCRFLKDLEEEAEWIERARAEMCSEAARGREIGRMMAAAGLRSYADKEGRIYVAGLRSEALDELADCVQYKSEYLVHKHGDLETIARLRKALAEEE